jgi:AcrR family transcriptional regulator
MSIYMSIETLPNDPSRDRLLLAAVEVFAERGFRDATVREICAQAEVNAASVNYYFGGKEKLYAEALAFAFRQANQRYPLGEALDKSLPAETRLAAFIRVFLHRLLDNTALGHHGKLIAHEIANPTNALDEIFGSTIQPQFAVLREIVPALLGPNWTEPDIHRCALSILGQCLMYKHSRSVIDRICPEIVADSDEIERTAEHIVQFSLLALQGLAANWRGL